MGFAPDPESDDPRTVWDRPTRVPARIISFRTPPGFTVEGNSDGTSTIHYRRAGLGCVLAAITVFAFSALPFFLMEIVGSWLGEDSMIAKMSDAIPITAMFYLIVPGIAYFYFSGKSFHLGRGELVVTTNPWVFQYTRTIPRGAIQRVWLVDCASG